MGRRSLSRAKFTLPDFIRRVESLALPSPDYAVFGSGPLLAHGLVASVNDVNILARGAARERAKDLGTPQRAPGGDERVRLEDTEIFNGWLGLDVDAVIDGAELTNGLPFARLTDVVAFKKRLNRPKDEAHLRLLESYLRGGHT